MSQEQTRPLYTNNIPLDRKVCMDSYVAERDYIAPFYLRVRVAKFLREVGSGFSNHSQLVEGSGLMQFAGHESRGIHSFQKGLKHVAGIKDVLQIEVFTPHTILVRWPEHGHE